MIDNDLVIRVDPNINTLKLRRIKSLRLLRHLKRVLRKKLVKVLKKRAKAKRLLKSKEI